MSEFKDVREAKEFLVGKIVAEAQRQGEPLSQVEEKMLYFSETGWTLPEMVSVAAAFNRDYDEVEFEHKIAALVRNHRATVGNIGMDEEGAWEAAVQLLRKQDHYLTVLVDIAKGRLAAAEPPAIGSRWLTLVAYGAAVAAVLFLVGYFVLVVFKL